MGRLGIERHGSRGGRRGSSFAPALVAVAALALLGSGSTPATAKIELRATGLAPGFRAAIRDYTVPCAERTRLVVRAPGTADARIGSRRVVRALTRAHRAADRGSGDQGREAKPRRSRHLLDSLSAGGLPELQLRPAARDRATTTTSSIRSDPGWLPYVFIFDRWGVPVWWRRVTGAIDAKVIDRSIAWATDFQGLAFNTDPDAAYELRRPERPAGRPSADGRHADRRSTTCSRPRTATTCCSPTGFAPASTPALTTATRTQPSTTASCRR